MIDVPLIWLKWAVFIASEKIMDVVNLFTAPVVVLFAGEDGWLPSWLWWWQTPDNSLDGDVLWQTERRPFRRNAGIYRYVNRIAWLYRNSMNGYAEGVVGIDHDPDYYLFTNFNGLGPPYGKASDYRQGLLTWRLYDGAGRLKGFQLFYILPWSSSRCLRVNIGWKLWTWDDPELTACQCVLSFNPWKSFPD